MRSWATRSPASDSEPLMSADLSTGFICEGAEEDEGDEGDEEDEEDEEAALLEDTFLRFPLAQSLLNDIGTACRP